MRHRVAGYKLNRDSEHRIADRRNAAISLFTHGQITTTIPKAKSLKPFVEKLITLARKDNLANRRRVIQAIGNPFLIDRDLKDFDRKELKNEGIIVNKYHELKKAPRVVAKLFTEIGPEMAERQGGYTRIIKLGTHRVGDAADLCILQLVGNEEGPQVSGDYSRRRQKANRRMEFAAKLRKQKGEAETPAEEEKPEAATEEAPVAEASTEAAAETPAEEPKKDE